MAVVGFLQILALAVLTDCQTLTTITADIPGVHSPGSWIKLTTNCTPSLVYPRVTISWLLNEVELGKWLINNVTEPSQDSQDPKTNRSNVSGTSHGYTRIITLEIFNLTLKDNSSVVKVLAQESITNASETYNLHVSGFALCPFTECILLQANGAANGTGVEFTNDHNYNSVVNYSCVKGNLYVGGAMKESYSQTCTVSAVWQPPTVGECWYAPSNVSVKQNTFYENERLNLSCISTNDGYPTTTGFYFFFKNLTFNRTSEDLDDTLNTLTSKDYNKTYSCRIISKYTNLNKEDGSSENQTMTVYFGPETVEDTPSKYIPMNQSDQIIVRIKANDRDSNLKVFMSKNGINVSSELNQTLAMRNDIFYDYSYMIEIKSVDDYGVYVFNAQTSDPSDSLVVNITILSEEITTTSSPPINSGLRIGVIVGACAVGVAVISLLIFLMLLRRRRQKNCGDKEERLNPIYDVSNTGAMPEKEDRVNPLYGGYSKSADTTNVKEERINPLYGSTSEGSSAKKEETALSSTNIEEAYSTVEKGGKDNPVFSAGGNNDTYTEVKKVNTRKDKNAISSPECMYAEVKKDKPKAKDTNTGLHGSTNSTTAK